VADIIRATVFRPFIINDRSLRKMFQNSIYIMRINGLKKLFQKEFMLHSA